MSMLKWTVEFSVDESWVADGFDLTDERAKEMLNNDLQYAFGHELNAKVTKAPTASDIATLQGYTGTGAYGLASGIKRIQKEREDGKL